MLQPPDTYEKKEIVMYSYFKKLDHFSTECIYSPNAYRVHAVPPVSFWLVSTSSRTCLTPEVEMTVAVTGLGVQVRLIRSEAETATHLSPAGSIPTMYK